jgi:hypothetical protein
METIPDELISHILSFLTPKERIAFYSTSHKFLNFYNDKSKIIKEKTNLSDIKNGNYPYDYIFEYVIFDIDFSAYVDDGYLEIDNYNVENFKYIDINTHVPILYEYCDRTGNYPIVKNLKGFHFMREFPDFHYEFIDLDTQHTYENYEGINLSYVKKINISNKITQSQIDFIEKLDRELQVYNS